MKRMSILGLNFRKGFTLLEFILGMCITSMILLLLNPLLKNSLSYNERISLTDDLYLNGHYAVDFIKKEVLESDLIFSTKKIEGFDEKFPENIGFIAMKATSSSDGKGKIYNYKSYYKKDKELVRVACNMSTKNLPKTVDFLGYNTICFNVEDLSGSRLDLDKKLIYINIRLENKGAFLEIINLINIRCNILE